MVKFMMVICVTCLGCTSCALADMPARDIKFLQQPCHSWTYWRQHPVALPYVLLQDVCVPFPRPDPRKKLGIPRYG